MSGHGANHNYTPDDLELCMEYNKDLERLKEILEPPAAAKEPER